MCCRTPARDERRRGNLSKHSGRARANKFLINGEGHLMFAAWGLRESKKRNQAIGNSRESNVRESSGTADSEYPSLVFYPNNNQILEIYCAYWSLFSRPASLSCLPGTEANEKECINCKLIKKAETKNHHQIILGNHEFSGKRLEEKSEQKRKKVSS